MGDNETPASDDGVVVGTPLIPVIDITSFLDGTDLVTAPEQVNTAAVHSGFFQIVGHGIPIEKLDAVYSKSIQLAQMPQDYRDSLVSPVGHPYRGLTTNIDKAGQVRSLRMHASHFDNSAHAEAAGVPAAYSDFFSPNVWPEEVVGYHEAVRDLFEATQQLGASMMKLFAVALSLPDDYFDALIEPNASSCSINYYPARHAPLTEHPTVIFDEHFDGGTLTILHQRGTYEGLQIRDLEGNWFPVPVIDEALVINMGELMMRWTNGLWPATRHRVVASEDPEGHRTTLTTFHLPAVDTVIEPLKTTYGSEGPQFDPVSVYDWEQRFIKKTYAERKHLVTGDATEAYLEKLNQQ
ncbi:isopenicillin N synthase family oxygenase [Nakamurella sp. YIM 132087]|uniref:Isopenicillin N synthase family oxygenase n=1 Tax=Nakamurella alba TaxID=2665158 RepID=A0A7K1FGG5_9ACTN|nr:2OG-Fe(II) oxygenase family protein [Nakamurella alba]MTD13207.1 isopenicillin N synthase family oxygenase [Nakamurella alba]